MKKLYTFLLFAFCLVHVTGQDCNVTFEDFNGYDCSNCNIQSESSNWISSNTDSPPADILEWGNGYGNVINVPSNYYQGDNVYQPEIIHVLDINNPGIVTYDFVFYNECGVLTLDFLNSNVMADDAYEITKIELSWGRVVVGQDTLTTCFSEANELNPISVTLDFDSHMISLNCTEGPIYTTSFLIDALALYGVAFGSNQCNYIDNICVSNSSNIVDNDGDSYFTDVDCDDNNPLVNPGADEIPYNGIDDDCNVATLEDDLDEDGFMFAVDCDDTNPNIYPGAPEINGNDVDEDCDGEDGQLSSTADLNENSIAVFPNPTKGVIETTEGNIAAVIDLTGRIVIRGGAKEADLSALSPGVYLVEIVFKEASFYERVVKN